VALGGSIGAPVLGRVVPFDIRYDLGIAEGNLFGVLGCPQQEFPTRHP